MHEKQPKAYLSKDFVSKVDKRMLLIVSYMLLNCNIAKKVGFTIDALVRGIGYVPNRNKGKINEAVRGVLLELARKEVVAFDIAVAGIKNNEFVYAYVNRKQNAFSLDKEKTNNVFVQLLEEEFSTIIKSDVGVDKGTLLAIYLN